MTVGGEGYLQRMSAMADGHFTELLASLRDSAFGTCAREKVVAACHELGWAVTGNDVEIPNTPNGGRLVEYDAEYEGSSCVELHIDVATIAAEQFRTYLVLAVGSWGNPTWYYGADDLRGCWLGDDTARQLIIDFDGNLQLTIGSSDALIHDIDHSAHQQDAYLDWIDDELDLTEEDSDQALALSYESDLSYTWFGWTGEFTYAPSNGWTAYTPHHLRALLTRLLRDTHFAMRAVGPGPDCLRLEFPPNARLELSLAEARLYAEYTDLTHDYLTDHGFTDRGDGWAERIWPADPDGLFETATATVLFLEAHGDDELTMTGPGESIEDGTLTRQTVMAKSSLPLPLDGFYVDIHPDFD
ncbi:hypothetical protein [Nocardia sp. NPDC050406]|uniref:hypothetical protein n=1 Tax=Nocardia sp. NPDC050406 TaxID=3364318 RepID=UPI0037BD6A60